jgi:predicted TPR repeat methyltransferase
MKNLKKKVSKYYKNFDNKLDYSVPNETLFRLLGNNKILYKKKNVLDIGIGNGDNLLEFKRRKANIFGIDIRKKITNIFVSKHNLNSKNFFCCDLNYDFPKIDKKIDLVICKDTLYYLTLDRQFELFKKVKKILKKKGYFLIQYIQTQLKKKKKGEFSSYDLSSKSDYKVLKRYFDKNNPLPILSEKHIMELVKSEKFYIKNNIFDINTQIRNKKTFLIINRYLLLQK